MDEQCIEENNVKKTKDKVSRIEERIQAKGYKCTRSRSVIIQLFVESKEHLKPEQIYLQTRNEGISLATVYRTIDILKKTDVIKETVIQNDRYYELKMYSKKHLHIHFYCTECGQIKEYSNSRIFEDLIEQRDYIEEVFEDKIEDIMIVMNGICRSCKEQEGN